jgi:hypothetical protein
MFPNFTSLAQREQKRQELLERAQRRVRQASTKRDMYADASWGSDIDRGISTVKSTTSTQTDTSVGNDETIPLEVKQTMNSLIDNVIAQSNLKNSLSDENSNKTPEVSTSTIGVNTTPSVADVGVNTTRRPLSDATFGVDIPSVRRPLSDASFGVDIPSVTVATPPVAETTPPVVEVKQKIQGTLEKVSARERIKTLFKSDPKWATLEIIPINAKTGGEDYRFILGKNASIITVDGKHKYKNYNSIDWIGTEGKILALMEDEREDKRRGEERLKVEEPKSAHERIKSLFTSEPN